MRDLDLQLSANERAGQRRINIAHDDDPIGLLFQHHRLKGGHDRGGLSGVRARTYSEIHVGRWQIEVAKERLGHGVVVMLPRMYDEGLEFSPLLHGCDNRRNFHEVRSGTGDNDYLEHLCGRDDDCQRQDYRQITVMPSTGKHSAQRLLTDFIDNQASLC